MTAADYRNITNPAIRKAWLAYKALNPNATNVACFIAEYNACLAAKESGA